LSELLRYAVYHSTRDQVTLAEEFEMVKNYMELEKVQHEKRLNVVYELEEGFDDYLLPPMTIQMLAENAVKHGIARRKEGGTVRFEVRSNGSGCVVSVLNDGELSGEIENKGVGLQNIRERLKNLIGCSANLKLMEDRESGLVKATFTIPA
jgi:LytS/YehU family sensor histidine kinase